MLRHLSLILLFIIFLCLVVQHAYAVDALRIDWRRGAEYLPFAASSAKAYRWPVDYRRLAQPVQVIRPATNSSDSFLIATSANAQMNQDSPGDISVFAYPGKHYFFETPIWLTLTDYTIVFDTASGICSVIGGGYRNDTAFVYSVRLDSAALKTFLPVATGRDSTGDGVWRGELKYLAQGDFDCDGLTEVFFRLDPSRDYVPRLLLCVEAETMILQWSVPMPCGVNPANFHLLYDSLDGAVAFTSWGQGQGVQTARFDDQYGYFTIIDTRGNIRLNKVITGFGADGPMRRLPRNRLCVLNHTFFFDDSAAASQIATTDNDRAPLGLLSLVDVAGELHKTVPAPERITFIWLGPYTGSSDTSVYCLGVSGTFYVYDTALNLLAKSEPTNVMNFMGAIESPEQGQQAWVFGVAGGIDVYSQDLRKLFRIDPPADYITLVSRGSKKDSLVYLTSTPSEASFVTIVRRDLLDYAAIFYLDNRTYILTILASLAAGVVAIGFNRQRLASQKKQLELAHQELAATHDQLKRAQQQLIEAEKYKQAKDIAGGFAHEIRNALLPAEVALAKLERQTDIDKPKQAIKQAVSRALDLTGMIAEYTRLDQSREVRPVKVIDAVKTSVANHEYRLTSNCMRLEVSAPDSHYVLADRNHLIIVLDNLIGNALDALSGQSNGAITITSRVVGDAIAISVTDNGPGIPPEVLPRIFDAFFSTKPSTGRGLGLSLVNNIIMLYDGKIDVASHPGRETSFTLTLPLWEG